MSSNKIQYIFFSAQLLGLFIRTKFRCQGQLFSKLFNLDARVQFLEARVQFRFQSFPSTEGNEGLALTPCQTIWSPEIIWSDIHSPYILIIVSLQLFLDSKFLPPLPALPPLQWCSSSVSRSQRLPPRILPGAFANAEHVQTRKT